jgi:uncharacterized protein YkwD
MKFRRLRLLMIAAVSALSLQAWPVMADALTPAERDEILAQHNKYRAQHCSPPLTWSNEIAAAAQRWAERCSFSHNGADKFGENIAWGGDRTMTNIVEAWYSEVKNYNFAKPGTSSGVGHFTQIVWKNTKQIGCGVSKCILGSMRYVVCQYSPQANWTGQYGANVLPRCEAPPTTSSAKPGPAPVAR